MRLICEYTVRDDDGTLRQLFTTHSVTDIDHALIYICTFPAIVVDTLEEDDTLTLGSRYLPPDPVKVWGCIDSYGRYRYFYLYTA